MKKRWARTVAVEEVNCPHCGAKPGERVSFLAEDVTITYTKKDLRCISIR